MLSDTTVNFVSYQDNVWCTVTYTGASVYVNVDADCMHNSNTSGAET
jgi:hypothetical protein